MVSIIFTPRQLFVCAGHRIAPEPAPREIAQVSSCTVCNLFEPLPGYLLFRSPALYDYWRRNTSGRYTRRVLPSTAHLEKWLGQAVTVLAAVSTTLLGSFTHWLPFHQ